MSGIWYPAALGWPNRRRAEKGTEPDPLGVPNANSLDCTSTGSPSSLVSGLAGFVALTGRGMGGPPAAKESAWSEQTSRASIPALRSRVQYSWAPKSRDPLSLLAAALKSDFSKTESAFRGSLYWLKSMMSARRSWKTCIIKVLLILSPQSSSHTAFCDPKLIPPHLGNIFQSPLQRIRTTKL